MTCKDDGAWTNDEMTYEDWKYAVKLIYDHSKTTNKDGKKIIDPTKPLRAYIKLETKGKGKNIKCYTKIFGPGDKKMSPCRCMNVHGACHPLVLWESIYWGAHDQASYGASVRLRVTEMNFSPCLMERSVYIRRMLPLVQEKESEDSETDYDELTFESDSVFESD